MSRTSVYELYKTKVNCVAELRNGHGSGPAVWDYISFKLTGERMPMAGEDDDFWPLWKDGRLSRNEKAVLLSTYDNGFVEVAHLAEFSEACFEVHKLIIENTNWEWNHFEGIGKAAILISDKPDYRCKGLAIGCTSVCDEWEGEIYNIRAWGVYSQIASLTT